MAGRGVSVLFACLLLAVVGRAPSCVSAFVSCTTRLVPPFGIASKNNMKRSLKRSASSFPFTDKMLHSMKKDALIALLNVTIQNKEETIEVLKEAKKASDAKSEEMINEKEKRIQDKEETIKGLVNATITLEAELSLARAEFTAEVNLRPLIEYELRKWCTSMNIEYGSTTEAQNHFYQELCEGTDKESKTAELGKERARFTDCLNRALALGKPAGAKVTLVKREIEDVFKNLSEGHHNTRKVRGIKGFVVNGGAQFSCGVSAMLMFFKHEHTVMSNDYEEVRYKWSPDEG